jgi:hypothetical protein
LHVLATWQPLNVAILVHVKWDLILVLICISVVLMMLAHFHVFIGFWYIFSWNVCSNFCPTQKIDLLLLLLLLLLHCRSFTCCCFNTSLACVFS